jgi:hypothetical protein
MMPSDKARTLRGKDDEALSSALANARGAQERQDERAKNAARAEASRPKHFGLGDTVIVHEPGITDEIGVVHALKYSNVLDVWYAEIRYDSDGMSRSVPAQFVEA